jgi:hypothetical protein
MYGFSNASEFNKDFTLLGEGSHENSVVDKSMFISANKDLLSLKSVIAKDPKIASVFDVKNSDEFFESKISYGFEIYTIDPKYIIEGKNELKYGTKGTGDWVFILKNKLKVIGSITISKSHDEWKLKEFGGLKFSREVDDRLYDFRNFGTSNFRIVRIFSANADFLEIYQSNNGQVLYAPLPSSRKLFPQLIQNEDRNKLYDGSLLLESLRRNINHTDGKN